MQVFISWSGTYSKSLAEALRNWLPTVIQAVRPYFTPDDIAKGTRWSSEIAAELDKSKLGIICLTPENLNSSWIMFEAGALSKNLDQAKVVPILFGLDPASIQGPLVQFQAAPFSESEIKKVVLMINNELGDASLPLNVLDSVFDKWWPDLERKVAAISAPSSLTKSKGTRTDRDILEEVLSLSRQMTIYQDNKSIRHLSIRDIDALVSGLSNLILSFDSKTLDGFNDSITRMYRAITNILEYAASVYPDEVDNLNSQLELLKHRAIKNGTLHPSAGSSEAFKLQTSKFKHRST